MKIPSALAIGLSALLLPAMAAAQDFPNKPIRLIVPFPPGGPNDIIARVIGQRMSELTRQPVLIDNRGGTADRPACWAPMRSPRQIPTATPSGS